VPQFPHARSLVNGDFNLRVTQDGVMRWNGATISMGELRTFARQFGEASPLRLVVQFEGEKAHPSRATIVNALAESETCRQGRCFEAAWNAHRPPVVY